MLLQIPFPICPSTPTLSRPFSSDESAPSTPQTLCPDLLPFPALLDSAGTAFPPLAALALALAVAAVAVFNARPTRLAMAGLSIC